jgi:hypothetical protein
MSETLVKVPEHLLDGRGSIGWHCVIDDKDVQFVSEPSTASEFRAWIDFDSAVTLSQRY